MGMDANRLRKGWVDFFVGRGHTQVPSSGIIPHHPTAPMFTNAGMIQFVPYFLGEEPAPWPRATSIQKCIRLSGKHNDVDEVGRTRRHFTFFEMLGNFSFGDYFKAEAIPMAWELLTETLGFDGDRLWMTVHESDDEAEQIWHDVVGVPMDRIQRLGDKDNFWEMGDTGPCGPCSEIHFDCGPEWGDEGGPAHGGGDRYLEFWNLVFMQYFRRPDGGLEDLPKKNVDTGGGMERFLMLLNDTPTAFETDALYPMVETVRSITGRPYTPEAPDEDTFGIRLVADHSRSMSFLVSDGVVPSNEERGYVLRSVIRRAVRRLYQLGVDRPVLPELIGTVVDTLGEAYPDLVRNRDAIVTIIGQEEERFRHTLKGGSVLLEEELAASGRVSGEVAFKLHDTFGFPIEITEEIAAERGVELDRAGFDAAMAAQKQRSKAASGKAIVTAGAEGYRDILEQYGTTDFVGYEHVQSKAEVVAVLPRDDGRVEVFLDRTPFYAEGGGQVGDIGLIVTSDGARVKVLDTTQPVTGLHRHLAEVVDGELQPGDEVTAAVDVVWREGSRRNHTGTHLLHASLRELLGAQVRQQSSYVGPDRLRFDINHHQPLSTEEIEEVERLVNDAVMANEPVRTYETTMEHAKELGALMFFGDKYGDVVRVVEAGHRSTELCGGTHVHALGSIGPLKVLSEGSIGSNLRRVEAVTGTGALATMVHDRRLLGRVAELLRTKPDDVPEAIERVFARQKELEGELKLMRANAARAGARQLAAAGEKGFVVARQDGLTADELRDLAVAVRNEPGIQAVVLIGSPDGERVSLVSAVRKGIDLVAGELLVDAARTVGGGGNPKAADVGVAGGKNPAAIDEAIAVAREKLGLPNA